MTGSSYVPIVVPIIAFLAMACWLGLVFYADSHPGYKHRKPQPVDDLETGQAVISTLASTSTAPRSAAASSSA